MLLSALADMQEQNGFNVASAALTRGFALLLGQHTRQRSLLQTSETCSLSAFFLLQSSRSFRSCTRRLAIVLSSPCPPESDSIVICYRRRDFAHHPSLAFLTIALLQPDQSLSRHLYALSPVRPSINIEITGALLNHSCSTASTSTSTHSHLSDLAAPIHTGSTGTLSNTSCDRASLYPKTSKRIHLNPAGWNQHPYNSVPIPRRCAPHLSRLAVTYTQGPVPSYSQQSFRWVI